MSLFVYWYGSCFLMGLYTVPDLERFFCGVACKVRPGSSIWRDRVSETEFFPRVKSEGSGDPEILDGIIPFVGRVAWRVVIRLMS